MLRHRLQPMSAPYFNQIPPPPAPPRPAPPRPPARPPAPQALRHVTNRAHIHRSLHVARHCHAGNCAMYCTHRRVQINVRPPMRTLAAPPSFPNSSASGRLPRPESILPFPTWFAPEMQSARYLNVSDGPPRSDTPSAYPRDVPHLSLRCRLSPEQSRVAVWASRAGRARARTSIALPSASRGPFALWATLCSLPASSATPRSVY